MTPTPIIPLMLLTMVSDLIMSIAGVGTLTRVVLLNRALNSLYITLHCFQCCRW